MGIFQYEYFYVYDWLEKTRPSSRLNTQSVVPKKLTNTKQLHVSRCRTLAIQLEKERLKI